MQGLGDLPDVERQSSVVNVLVGLELRGLRDGELDLLAEALDDLGFNTESSLRAGATVLTVETIRDALMARGAQRALGLAVKAHAALEVAFGSSRPLVGPPRRCCGLM